MAYEQISETFFTSPSKRFKQESFSNWPCAMGGNKQGLQKNGRCSTPKGFFHLPVGTGQSFPCCAQSETSTYTQYACSRCLTQERKHCMQPGQRSQLPPKARKIKSLLSLLKYFATVGTYSPLCQSDTRHMYYNFQVTWMLTFCALCSGVQAMPCQDSG